MVKDNSLVTDIVLADHRSAFVFRKYAIDYCCGGKLPLSLACEIRGLDLNIIKAELAEMMRNASVSAVLNYRQWDADFLVAYLVNVHHGYLINTLPDLLESLEAFVNSHRTKYDYLDKLLLCVKELRDEILPHLEHEEQIIFPYVKQIAHAYHNNESYASLLVKTMRKPVESMMQEEHAYINKYLEQLRLLTNNYTAPPNACISHRVSFAKLRELDEDLQQHLFLENEILFSKTVQMERELLGG
ncbi:MAG: hypothetical protein EOO06_11400 [Chitinophagaceae bacterium]|nr:MAG: hypothetical protein EOO06_11400 [Chitinophagaceae bacterium]